MNSSRTSHLFAVIMALTGASLCFGLQAAPSYINGSISFTGNAHLDGPLGSDTTFTSFSDVSATVDTNGAYAPLQSSTNVTWASFTFNPPTLPVVPLWTVTSNGITYSFDATSMTVVLSSMSFLAIQGTGIAHITGHADTPGTWTMSASQVGSAVGFSASTMVSASDVPTLHCGPLTNGVLQMSWTALPGQPYQLESATNLTGSIWNNAGGVIATTNLTNITVTTNYLVGPDHLRLFRLVVLPQ